MIPKQILDKTRIDMQDVADIAAMTGVSYFKGAFRKKGFDGTPWPLAKDKAGTRRRGSLMIDSAALMNNVRIARATRRRSYGRRATQKVPYAEGTQYGRTGRARRGFQSPGVGTWATEGCGEDHRTSQGIHAEPDQMKKGGLAAPFFRRIISISPDGWTMAAVWRLPLPARRAGV